MTFGFDFQAFILILLAPIVFIAMAIRFLILKRKAKPINIKLEIVIYFLIMYFIGLFLVTLSPTGINRKTVLNLIPFVDMYESIMGIRSLNPLLSIKIIMGNVILFVPFGILVMLFRHYTHKESFKFTISGGILCSILIESSQYLFLMGRTANIDDVFLNTLGVLIGCVLVRLFTVKGKHNKS